MDKFDQQIAMLKPAALPARLDERQFMSKLNAVKHMQQQRRRILFLLALTLMTVVVGMFIRNITEVIGLTFRYISDLPALFSTFSQAYVATISWPGLASVLLSAAAGILLFRQRKALPTIRDRKPYNYASMLGIVALALGIIGLYGGSAHANAQQEELRRSLNKRGHLEVRVNNKDYELYAGSPASDTSIRGQAVIEQLRNFDISKAYPELENLNRDGFVTEIRTVHPKDDCVYYVERRLEPAINEIQDSNSGCIRTTAGYQTYYLNAKLKPIAAPNWKVGQAAYFSNAQKRGSGLRNTVGVVVLLDGKADDYVARQNSEKVVPKGQQGAGAQSCGINYQDVCPEVGGIDLFTNAEGQMASGEIGSSVPGDSLHPRPDADQTRFFGKITALNDHIVRIELLNGKQLAITWPKNYIAAFNATGAQYYQMSDGPLAVGIGDYIMLDVYYKSGMDLEQLSITDTRYIGLALKTTLPDPLANEKYDKAKAMGKTEKYRP